MTAAFAPNSGRAEAVVDSRILSPGEVRLERLRAGLIDETLFIVAEPGRDPAELNALVSAFVGPQEVYAVLPAGEDPAEPDATVERVAARLVTAVRQVQQAGPYRLGGSGSAGLVALEMARQLRAEGDAVQALFLIGTRHRSQATMPAARRVVQRLPRIIRTPRTANRTDGTSQTKARTPVGMSNASSGHRPGFYDGQVTLIAPADDRRFGNDPVRLWAGSIRRLDVCRVDGDHEALLRAPAAVANAIDHRLALDRVGWTGLRPTPGFERPLILTTMSWFFPARLAHALVEAGFSVSTCRPKGHALELVEGLESDCRLNRMRPLRSLAAAIKQGGPDIILPGDEPAVILLRRLHSRVQTSDPELADLIARSLGNVDDWPSIESRTGLADAARTLKVSAPATKVVADVDSLLASADEHGPAIVLKTDGSWGGDGVAIVRDPSHLREAWRAMSRPLSFPRALYRLLFDLEASSMAAWARRVRPVVNAQQYVDGREAICTVACVDGEVRAFVCLEVVQASEPKGPSAVVRIIDHPTMAEAARRLAHRFRLTGFYGFDFIITDTGSAQLLELNPRLTPTAHLLVEGNHRRKRTIALFPAETIPGAELGTMASGILDLPVRAPSLIRRGENVVARRHRPVARMARQLKQRFNRSRY